MANQEFYSRIIHKHDTEENWIKAINFIPKQGEIIIYDKDDNYDYERMKIGDGVSKVNDLPFNLDQISDTLADLGALTIDLEGSTEGTVATIDADTFQGYSIDRFVMYNVGSGDGEGEGDLPSITATSGVSIDLESAEESGQPVTVDADTLGGYPPAYFLENAGGGDVTVNLDGAEQSGQASTVDADSLGGIPADGYVKKSELDTSNMDLLWTNTSPSSEFSAKTISLSLSDYKAVYIEFRSYFEDTTLNTEFFIGKGNYYLRPTLEVLGHRKITISNTGIKFFDAGIRVAYNSEIIDYVNEYCVPYKIYGIK